MSREFRETQNNWWTGSLNSWEIFINIVTIFSAVFIGLVFIYKVYIAPNFHFEFKKKTTPKKQKIITNEQKNISSDKSSNSLNDNSLTIYSFDKHVNCLPDAHNGLDKNKSLQKETAREQRLKNKQLKKEEKLKRKELKNQLKQEKKLKKELEKLEKQKNKRDKKKFNKNKDIQNSEILNSEKILLEDNKKGENNE